MRGCDPGPCARFFTASQHAAIGLLTNVVMGNSVMARIFGVAALCLICLMVAVARGHAQPRSTDQAPVAAEGTLTALLPRDEVNRLLRAAGFSPLSPPQHQATMYVVRALDERDIVMRVVVDARSGAITAVNRVVPSRPDSVVNKMLPPHVASPYEPLPEPATSGSPPQEEPPHAMPADIGGTPTTRKEGDLSVLLTPSAMLSGTHPALPVPVPLPRPRPLNLTRAAKPNGKVSNIPSIKPITAPAAASITSTAPRSASGAPRSAPAAPHPRPPARPGPATPNGVPQIATPD